MLLTQYMMKVLMGNLLPGKNLENILPFQKVLYSSLGQGTTEGAKGLGKKNQRLAQRIG
jgi:hypothetical protein